MKKVIFTLITSIVLQACGGTSEMIVKNPDGTETRYQIAEDVSMFTPGVKLIQPFICSGPVGPSTECHRIGSELAFNQDGPGTEIMSAVIAGAAGPIGAAWVLGDQIGDGLARSGNVTTNNNTSGSSVIRSGNSTNRQISAPFVNTNVSAKQYSVPITKVNTRVNTKVSVPKMRYNGIK